MSLLPLPGVDPSEVIDLAVVGGGMSGLYVAAKADPALYPRRVVYEAAGALGGRVQTVELGEGRARFRCELGAMRFEWGLQPTFQALVGELGLAVEPFAPYSAPPRRVDPGWALTPAEADALREGDGSPFALWRWAILAILRVVCDALPARLAVGEDLSGDAWLGRLGEAHFHWLRTEAAFPVGAGASRVPLADLGIWNLLRAGVLSRDALALVMNEGTFYHFVHRNLSAAESVVFWTRVLQSNTSIKTIAGGVASVVERLAARAVEGGAEVRLGRRLTAIWSPGGPEGLLSLRFVGEGGRSSVVSARRVVLALPHHALSRLAVPFPADVRRILGDVIPMRMAKCFFLVDRPWWDDDRAQTHAGTDRLPAREIHYYSAPDRSVGMVMVYCDEPAFDFWAPLGAEGQRGLRHATFAALMGIPEAQVLDSRVVDWTEVPHQGAAAYFWKPGVRVYDAMRRLSAFDLAGEEAAHLAPRLSVCGCAYSEFQGFIEGALRTATTTLERLQAVPVEPAETVAARSRAGA